MKAISYEGLRTMSVSDHPKPKLKLPTDALLRVTTSGICGSDLHMYDGRTPLEEGTVVGHEIMGVIDEVGEAVQIIRRAIASCCLSISRVGFVLTASAVTPNLVSL
jgi:glutathione-independent formaldehyde dehydrogenase